MRMSTAADSGDLSRPPLRLLHDDRWLVAVDKPAGLLVHRTALDAQADEDLLTRLQAQLGARLWPVHRLDKGTSGVLLLARDVDTARSLGAVFAAGAAGAVATADALAGVAGAGSDASLSRLGPPATDRSVEKRYIALVRGWPAPTGRVDTPLARDPELPSAGQPLLPASTCWQVLQRLVLPVATHPQHADTRLALLAVQPLTGRRHQIRRHCKALAHPLVGDATHGKGPLNRAVAAHLGLARLWLHAEALRLTHPVTGASLDLRSDPGPDWPRLALFVQPA